MERKKLDNLKVLLAEDNEMNQLLMKYYLDAWNCILTICENGLEAVKKVKKEKFDLILMDIQMPVMNGVEATRTIRSIEGNYFKNIPIIAVTSLSKEYPKTKVIEAGMNDYLSKPFEIDKLFNVLEKVYKSK